MWLGGTRYRTPETRERDEETSQWFGGVWGWGANSMFSCRLVDVTSRYIILMQEFILN